MTGLSRAKTYLGDGAYAEWNGQALRIYNSNGVEESNGTFLEAEEIKKLLIFIETTVPGFIL